MKKFNLSKKVLFTAFGLVIGVGLILTSKAFEIPKTVTSAIAYLKKVIVVGNYGTTTGIVLDGSNGYIYANQFCDLTGGNCYDAKHTIDAYGRVNTNSGTIWYKTGTVTDGYRCVGSGSFIVCDQEEPIGSAGEDRYLTGAQISSTGLLTFYVSGSALNPSIALLTGNISNSETLAPTANALSGVNAKFGNLIDRKIPMRSGDKLVNSNITLDTSGENITIGAINISINTTTGTFFITPNTDRDGRTLEILGDSPVGNNLKGGDIYINAGTPGTTSIGGSVYINGGQGSVQNSNGNIILGKTIGRVGIGTDSPTQKLTVNGNLAITGANSFLNFTNSGYISASGNANQIFLGKNGNVGIKTNAPTASLTVSGDIKTNGNIIVDGIIMPWTTTVGCTGSLLGAIRYNTGDNILEGCLCNSGSLNWTGLYNSIDGDCGGGGAERPKGDTPIGGEGEGI